METKGLINFCDPNLQSTVSCNTCCSENYEETNLLSPEPSKFRRGFMVDRFIKPPVEVVLTFKYPVNLYHIVIWPRVGQQKSSGFEISTLFSDRNNDEKTRHNMSGSTNDVCYNSSERISSCYLSDNDNGVVFYCPRKTRKHEINDLDDSLKFVTRPFTWRKRSAITDVKTITIRITRTNASSVPALGKVEVWGLPGVNNTRCEISQLRTLWARSSQGNKQPKSTLPPGPAVSKLCQTPSTSAEPRRAATCLDVPEEFLDALTLEIMSVPMVLPSGKVVDQRTLERHQDNEANWGRPPNDPFTGLPFTPSVHPVLDNVLKSRIDHFLVMNQDREDLRFVPRTLGRKNPSSDSRKTFMGASISTTSRDEWQSDPVTQSNDFHAQGRFSPYTLSSQSLQSDSQSTQIFKSDCESVDNCQHHETVQTAQQEDPRTSEPENPASKEKLLLKEENSAITADNCRKRACSPEITILSESRNPKKISIAANGWGESVSGALASAVKPVLNNLENKTEDNVDAAVEAVLTGLPSFVNVDNRLQSQTQSALICCKCEAKNNLFKLPCQHLVCRICLVQSTKSVQPTCWNCSSSFTTSQPIKYNP